MKSIPESRRAH